MVEGARLESVYTVTPYRGFESHPLRPDFPFSNDLADIRKLMPILMPTLRTDLGARLWMSAKSYLLDCDIPLPRSTSDSIYVNTLC